MKLTCGGRDIVEAGFQVHGANESALMSRWTQRSFEKSHPRLKSCSLGAILFVELTRGRSDKLFFSPDYGFPCA